MKRQKIVIIAVLVIVALFIARISHLLTYPAPHVVYSVDGDTDESAVSQENYTAAVASAVATAQPTIKYSVSSSTPQFVIFSFDGSKSMPMLDETLTFEQKLAAEGKPLHFTYFINAAYFLTDANAKLYQAPDQPQGTSRIGFGGSISDVALRVHEFNTAFSEGNEIGSHSAGHFDGSAWTYDQWKQEFSSFASLLTNVQKNNSSQQIDAPVFLNSIHGFRAPNLGVNPNLYKVLSESGFTYDASGVSAADTWPTKDTAGLWHIPLGTVLVGSTKSHVISMDYNLWTHQSGAKEVAKKATPLWNTYYNEVASAYIDLFNSHYTGNRGPIVIGDHFSKWNDSVYWEAMKNLAENVCGQPQVRCVTMSTLVDYLNTTGAPALAQ